jgi:hypothetical protein
MKYILISLFINVWLLASCQNTTRHKTNDVFYSSKGGFDYVRIPLIKPYEAVKLNGSKEWLVNLKTATLQFSVSNIKEVTIVKGFILLHGVDTFLKGSTIKEAWFIIIPSKHIELGFDKYDKFVNYLLANGFERDPGLHNVEEIYLEYMKMDKVNW